MSSHAFTIKLASSEAAQRYFELHNAVPPEIGGPSGALEVIGLTSMEIFHAAPDSLFMLVRGKPGFDPKVGFPLANELHPAVQAWDDVMHGELLERVPGNDTELNWFAMEPVYRWTLDDVRRDRETHAPTLLDCTLRDGGFQTNWQFSDALLRDLIPAAHAARADLVEIGYLNATDTPGTTPLAHAARMIADATKGEGPGIAVMADLKTWEAEGEAAFPLMQAHMAGLSSNIDCVRIALSAFCDEAQLGLALSLADKLQAAGHTATLNLMQIDRKPPDQALALAGRLRDTNPETVIYLADSFGAMRPTDVERLVGLYREVLPNPLGFHAHDNLGLGVANCVAAMRAGASWIDGTFGGMGRGAGNAALEHLAALYDRETDAGPVGDFLSRHIQPLRDKLAWGPSPIYAACARGGVHPSYGQRLLGDARLDDGERLSVIADLAREQATRFDPVRLDRNVRLSA